MQWTPTVSVVIQHWQVADTSWNELLYNTVRNRVSRMLPSCTQVLTISGRPFCRVLSIYCMLSIEMKESVDWCYFRDDTRSITIRFWLVFALAHNSHGLQSVKQMGFSFSINKNLLMNWPEICRLTRVQQVLVFFQLLVVLFFLEIILVL